MNRIRRRSEEGYVMVTALIALAVMALLAAAAISQASTALRISGEAVRSEQALYLANAGVETILARTLNPSMIEENKPYTYAMQLEPDVTGRYEAVVTVPRPGVIQIRSTGTVEQSGNQVATRLVQAEIPFTWPGSGSGGGGGGGVKPPSQLVQGNGPITLNNTADVCGDLYGSGNITLGNNVTVWSKTRQQDPDSPCESILGSGKAVASGTLTKGNKTVIQGGWCDQEHFGAPYPCDSKPQVATLAAPDWAGLRAGASRWYVKPADAAFCADKEPGTCQVLQGDESLLTIAGNRSFNRDIVYVDGDLTVPQQANQEMVVGGSVAFAVTGTVTVGGDLHCTAGSTCDVLIIAGGNIDLGNKKEVRATLQAQGSISGNQTTIYGNLIAAGYALDNGVTLYPRADSTWTTSPVSPPPGGGGVTPTEAFSDWDQ